MVRERYNFLLIDLPVTLRFWMSCDTCNTISKGILPIFMFPFTKHYIRFMNKLAHDYRCDYCKSQERPL